MKKSLVLLTAAVIVCCLVILTGCSGQPTVTTVNHTDENGVVYTLFRTAIKGTEKTEVKVTGYIGKNNLAPGELAIVEISSKITVEGEQYPVVAVENTAFYKAAVTKVVVCENVTEIGDFAFAYCEAGEIELPKTIKKIGSYAFTGCNGLKILRLKAEQPPEIGENAIMFYNNDRNVYEPGKQITVRVPSDAKAAYFDAWYEYASIIK